MAKANTYELDSIEGYFGEKPCVVCGEKSTKRAFYYPTYMNGDAEWLGDYCKEHAQLHIVHKIEKGELEAKYKIGD